MSTSRDNHVTFRSFNIFCLEARLPYCPHHVITMLHSAVCSPVIVEQFARRLEQSAYQRNPADNKQTKKIISEKVLKETCRMRLLTL